MKNVFTLFILVTFKVFFKVFQITCIILTNVNENTSKVKKE